MFSRATARVVSMGAGRKGAVAAATLAATAVPFVFADGAKTKPAVATARAATTSPEVVATSYSGKDFDGDVTVLESRAVRMLFTPVRDADTGPAAWPWFADRLMSILAEEGLAHTPLCTPKVVRTPCGYYEGLEPPSPDSLAIVSIVRAGDSLLGAVRKAAPGAAVGKILIQRDETDPLKRPVLHYSKLPPDITKRYVMLVDPMLATGGSACKAVEVLIDRGVKEENIMFLNVVSCPEGLRRLYKHYPKVKVVTAAVDPKLNGDKYIVPGLGDYGDRYFNT